MERKVYKNLFVILACVFFITCLTSVIQASVIDLETLKYNGVKNSFNIQVTFPGYGDVHAKSGFYEVDLTAASGESLAWNGVHKGFCVEDVELNPGTYNDYKLYDIPTGNGYYDAALLMDNYYDNVIDNDTSNGRPGDLQIAIWEAVFDSGNSGSGYDLDGGNFLIRDSSYDTSIVDTWLTALNGGNLDFSNEYNYMVASDDGNSWMDRGNKQDVLVRNEVPSPGAVWVLGSGFLGLIGFRRKQGKKA
jgi:hypothetical protein